ncbi:YjjG family noncanonical pyrimidine nucleotidase [Vagococcus sp.]|uniref:YjjG family noncanonical pyrimidine nucleotidase n=1 Tax=Vagococcus sp. TaxID=1933889 RepID=UPI003F9949A8
MKGILDSMKNYEYIIFDLDNTILDFSKSERVALEKVFTHYGVIFNEASEAKYKEINGRLWDQLEQGLITRQTLLESRFYLFFKTQGIEVEGALADEEFRSFLETRSDLISGAEKILSELQKQGYCLLAGTNGIGKTQRARLESNNLIGYFTKLFISEEVGFEKPDVRFFDYIFNTLQIKDNAKVLMVGDSLSSDIEGANRVGIDSIWLNPHQEINLSKARPTYEIQELNEIKRLFNSELKSSS